MPVQREARHLSGADIGRTIDAYDAYGEHFNGAIEHVSHAAGRTTVSSREIEYALFPSQIITTTGATQ